MSPHDDVDLKSVYSQFCALEGGESTVILLYLLGVVEYGGWLVVSIR